jgi:hypothetical protein
MPDSSTSRERNQVIVESERTVLMEAARNLTADIEPAAVYSLAPHAPSQDEEQE